MFIILCRYLWIAGSSTGGTAPYTECQNNTTISRFDGAWKNKSSNTPGKCQDHFENFQDQDQDLNLKDQDTCQDLAFQDQDKTKELFLKNLQDQDKT